MENPSAYLPATNNNVNLISTALKLAGFDLVKRTDTVDNGIWHLYIVSLFDSNYGTFADIELYFDFKICTMVGRIKMYELETIQQVLFECYEKITNREE